MCRARSRWPRPGAGAPPADDKRIVYEDPRLAEMGFRVLAPVPPGFAAAPGNVDGDAEWVAAEAYHAHRIALGVPEAGKDYPIGDTFPHEADLDLLNGVSFEKGCFIGQEVVSRMKHRGNVRKRVVPVEAEAPLRSGAPIMVGEAEIGSIGSVAGSARARPHPPRSRHGGERQGPGAAGGRHCHHAAQAQVGHHRGGAGSSRGGDPMSADEIERCPWAGIADPLYARYHDEEWGVPKTDDRALFEKLVLEGFQAGLSWLTILKKRENFRTAFHGFDAARIARYTDKDIARLMADAGIVRNRLKVEATIANARALLKLQERTSLAAFLWGFLDGRPQINKHRAFGTVPAATPTSKAMSKALLAEGFRFVGPTTVYAFMQAVGMVNDHLVGCFRYEPCARLQAGFKLPAAGRVASSGVPKRA